MRVRFGIYLVLMATACSCGGSNRGLTSGQGPQSSFFPVPMPNAQPQEKIEVPDRVQDSGFEVKSKAEILDILKDSWFDESDFVVERALASLGAMLFEYGTMIEELMIEIEALKQKKPKPIVLASDALSSTGQPQVSRQFTIKESGILHVSAFGGISTGNIPSSVGIAINGSQCAYDSLAPNMGNANASVSCIRPIKAGQHTVTLNTAMKGNTRVQFLRGRFFVTRGK